MSSTKIQYSSEIIIEMLLKKTIQLHQLNLCATASNTGLRFYFLYSVVVEIYNKMKNTTITNSLT